MENIFYSFVESLNIWILFYITFLSKPNTIERGGGLFSTKIFEFGNISIKNIIQEIYECKMNIISSNT